MVQGAVRQAIFIHSQDGYAAQKEQRFGIVNNANGRVASLCFGQTKTACYPLRTLTSNQSRRSIKNHNKGGRPKKRATEKLTYRVAVKLAISDYFRLLTRAYVAKKHPHVHIAFNRIDNNGNTISGRN